MAKDVLNALFFIIVGAITVLTYRRARVTLLQPIKTEVFKVQLQELSAVLKLFVGKGETELRDDFALDDLFVANAFRMFDAYAHRFFDLEISEEGRPYSVDRCPGALFEKEHAEKYLILADEHLSSEDQTPALDEKPDPRVRAALWADYAHGYVSLPRKYSSRLREFESVLESPVLPRKLADLLQEYLGLVHENVMNVSNVLTAAAREMPEKYQTAELMKKASINWVRHRFVDEFKHLKPKADEITDFIRHYYGTDTVLDVR